MTKTGRLSRGRRTTLVVMIAVLGLGLMGAIGQIGRPSGTGRTNAMLVSPGGMTPTDAAGQPTAKAPSGATGASTMADASAPTGGAGSAPGQGAVPKLANTLPAGLGAPKVVKTASLGVEVKKGAFSSAFSQVATIAAGNGGFVSSSSSSSSATGTVVLRVPADKFEATRQQLAGLGKVTSDELKGEDMSGTLADLDARLRNLRSQEEAIRLIMGKAKTIGETIQVQDQLSQVRDQIERLAGEQARLTDAVAFSTLTVTVTEPGVPMVTAPKEPSPLATSWRRAIDGAESIVAGVIVSLGYLVPLGVLAGLAWLVARRARRSVNAPAGIPA